MAKGPAAFASGLISVFLWFGYFTHNGVLPVWIAHSTHHQNEHETQKELKTKTLKGGQVIV